MYKIYVDDLILYHPLTSEYSILSGKVDLAVNTAGSLTFTIPETNPHYGLTKLMKSIVTLYDDDRLIFRGRPYAPNRNLFKDNEIICEGDLAFFNDSIQEPFEYFGTVEGLFRQVVENHNAQVEEEKRFIVGNITVVNSTEEGNITRSSEDYLDTWSFLKDKFFESALGGYLWVRHENGNNYIDYLADLNYLGNQDVEQSINLVDAKESVSSDELATAVIPLGAKVDDVYTTIESVNNNVKYLYDEKAVAEYGWIFKVVKHDNINDPSILLSTGRQDLADAIGVTTTIEVKASDLSKAGYNVSPFSLGTYVNVNIKNLNVDRKMLIKKLSFDLLKPESSEITVGDEIKSFTSTLASGNNNIFNSIKININNEYTHRINEVETRLNSVIEQSERGIKTYVNESYYLKDDTDTLIREVKSIVEQLSDSMTVKFTETNNKVGDVDADLQSKFNTITKYFTFDIDGLTIGQSESPFKVVIDNDLFTMYVNGVGALTLDPEGNSTIPELIINKKLNLLGYLIDKDENGNVNCEYVGG